MRHQIFWNSDRHKLHNGQTAVKTVNQLVNVSHICIPLYNIEKTGFSSSSQHVLVTKKQLVFAAIWESRLDIIISDFERKPERGVEN
jgi:hypothetical protein